MRIDNRKMEYDGSMMHFMRRILYAGRSISEGFLAEKSEAVPNVERERIKTTSIHPDVQGPELSPWTRSIIFTEEVLKEPDPGGIIAHDIITPPEIASVTIDSARNRRLYFLITPQRRVWSQ